MENSDFYKSPLCNALYTISLVILNFDWNAFMRQSSLMGSEFSTFHLETYKSLVGPFKHFNRKHLASVRSFPMRVCQNVWQSDHLLLFQPIKKQLCWSIILWLVKVVIGARKNFVLWHSFRLSYDSMIMHKIDFFSYFTIGRRKKLGGQ